MYIVRVRQFLFLRTVGIPITVILLLLFKLYIRSLLYVYRYEAMAGCEKIAIVGVVFFFCARAADTAAAVAVSVGKYIRGVEVFCYPATSRSSGMKFNEIYKKYTIA